LWEELPKGKKKIIRGTRRTKKNPNIIGGRWVLLSIKRGREGLFTQKGTNLPETNTGAVEVWVRKRSPSCGGLGKKETVLPSAGKGGSKDYRHPTSGGTQVSRSNIGANKGGADNYCEFAQRPKKGGERKNLQERGRGKKRESQSYPEGV